MPRCRRLARPAPTPTPFPSLILQQHNGQVMSSSPQRSKKGGLTKKVVSQESKYSGHRTKALSSLFTVRVLSGTHLLASDIQTEPPTSDPVCYIWCGTADQLPSIYVAPPPGEEGNPFFTTKVVYSTINPIWNEEFAIPLASIIPGTDPTAATQTDGAVQLEERQDPLARLLDLRCFVYLRDEDTNEDGSVTYDELGMIELSFTDLFSRARPLSNGLTINAQPYPVKKTPGMPNLGLNANLGTITLGATLTFEEDTLGAQIKTALGSDSGTFRDKELFERLQRAARGEPMEPPARPSTGDGLRNSRDRGRSSSPAIQPRPLTADGSARPSSATARGRSSSRGNSAVPGRAPETAHLKEEEVEERALETAQVKEEEEEEEKEEEEGKVEGDTIAEAEEPPDDGGKGEVEGNEQQEKEPSAPNSDPDEADGPDSSVALNALKDAEVQMQPRNEDRDLANQPESVVADTAEALNGGSIKVAKDKISGEDVVEAMKQEEEGVTQMDEGNVAAVSEPEVTGHPEMTEPSPLITIAQDPASNKESNSEEEMPSLLSPKPSLEPTLLANQLSTAVPVGGAGRAAAVALRSRDWEILNTSLEGLARITQEGLRDLGSRLSAVERSIEKDSAAAAAPAPAAERGSSTRKLLARDSKAGITPSSSISSLPATAGKKGSGASSEAFKKFRQSRSDASVRDPGLAGAPPSMELIHKTADGTVCSAPLGDETAMSPQRRSVEHFTAISINNGGGGGEGGGGFGAGSSNGSSSSSPSNVAPPPRAALNAIFPLATPVPAVPDWGRVTLWLRGGDLVSAYCEVLDRGTPTDFGRLLAEGGITPSALSVSVLNRACDQVTLLLLQGPGQYTEVGLLFVLAILRNGRDSCAGTGSTLLPRTKDGLVEALALIADLPSKQGLLAGLLQTQLSR